MALFSLVVNCLLLGGLIGLLVSVTNLLWRLDGAISAGTGKRVRLVIESTAVLPALLIHPAVLIALAFNPVGGFLESLSLPARYLPDRSTMGIVSLGVILYTPYGYIFSRFLPAERWAGEWNYSRHLGANTKRAFLRLMALPFIRACVVLTIVIGVLSQGMVFAPYLSQADWKTTLGREVYSGLVTSARSWGSTMIILVTIFLLGLVSARIRNLSLGSAPERDATSEWACMGELGRSTRLILQGVARTPQVVVALVNLTILLTLGYVTAVAFLDEGVEAIGAAFVSSTNDAPLFEAVKNTFLLALISGLLGTALAFSVAALGATRYTGGERSRIGKLILGLATMVALTPSIAYGAVLHTPLIKWPTPVLYLLVAGVTWSWLALFFTNGIEEELRAQRMIKVCFAMDWWSTVRIRKLKLLSLLRLIGFYSLVLGINEMALQLAAGTSFISFPQRLLPIARDGLTIAQWGAVGGLQLILGLILVPSVTLFRRVTTQERGPRCLEV